MSKRFAIEALSKAHQRQTFSCGNERIDRSFREAVSHDIKRRYATCFVVRDLEIGRRAGFYTLSSSTVPLTAVPEALASRLPRYPSVPAVLIGWLGRDQNYAGLGLGQALRAADFYAGFGFMVLRDRPLTLFMPVASAQRLLSVATSN